MSKLWLVSIYSFLFLASDMFLIQTRTIAVQFVFNTSLFLIIIFFLASEKAKNSEWKFIKNIWTFFWAGQILIYVISLRNIQKGYEYWFHHVYEYEVLIPIYIVSLLSAIVYTFIKGWKI